MKRKMNRKTLAEKYHLKDIAWALKQKKDKRRKRLNAKFAQSKPLRINSGLFCRVITNFRS
jgi:hypothetical protein